MENRLRLTIAMVALCCVIPANPSYAALDEQTASPSTGMREAQGPSEQVRTVTFDADGHIDIPRDNNGHIRIGTTFGRHGRRSLVNPHEGQTCGRMESKFKETAIEAVADAR